MALRVEVSGEREYNSLGLYREYACVLCQGFSLVGG